MATFSNSTTAIAASNALSASSSLSYHHSFSTSNGSHNNNLNNSSNSTSSDENTIQATGINNVNINNSFDTNASYLNSPDFPLCISSNQQTNPFDIIVSTSASPSNFNNDPLVRHFLNYRQNDSNLAGNYYSNMSAGPFGNTLDYTYTNMVSAPMATGLEPEVAVPNHGFSSTLSSNHLQHHSHSHTFMNSYRPYSHPQQQILKQSDSYSMPIEQQQSGNQQQNIFPWMRCIHRSCRMYCV